MADALQDSFKQFAGKKQEILSRLADTHEERIINTLKNLEDEIISDLTKLTDGGVKLNTQLAIKLRPNLKTLIEKNFLKEADSIVSEYDEIVKEYQRFIKPLPIAERFKSLTKPDLKVINDLKFLSFSGFEDMGNRFLDTIANEVYQSSVTGRPFNQMVKNIRGQINGVYQRSNETAINRLTDYIDKNRYSENAQIIQRVKNAREILHTKYASDILGNNMRRYASQIAQDSLMQFDGQFTLYKGKEAGITKYQYVGTNITTTRGFCRTHLNRVFTEEEARSLWQTTWRGKSGTDPFINRGGYRCRHSFILYDDDWFTEETDDNIKEQTKTNDRQRKDQAKKKTQSIVGNISSLSSPAKFNEIKPVSKAYLINKLNKQFSENSKDPKYLRDTEGNQFIRFSNQKQNDFGVAKFGTNSDTKTVLDFQTLKPVVQKTVYEFDDKDFGIIESLMIELDELAIKYNVPKIRGIKIERSAVASMGDGVLNLNPKYLKNKKISMRISNWKKGDKLNNRPFSTEDFFTDKADKIRSTFYHEFAHHIHQQKFNQIRNDYFAPKIELVLSKKTKDLKGKVASRYGDKNEVEWFAENFSLYEMKKMDLVDPSFLKFFKENVQ